MKQPPPLPGPQEIPPASRRCLTAQDRLAEIIQMRSDGHSLDVIGKAVGVTRERARQILKAAGGPTAKDARAAQRQQAADLDNVTTAQIRSLVLDRGAMGAAAVAAEVGISEADVGRLWPSDLRAFRVTPGNLGAVTWTDDEVLEAIRVAGTFEFPLRSATYDELVRLGEVDGPTSMRIVQRYGSWSSACTKAGVESVAPPREDYQSKWTDDDLLDVVVEYLNLPDAKGTYAGFDQWCRENAGAPSSQTVRNRLGSWSEVKVRALAIRPSRESRVR